MAIIAGLFGLIGRFAGKVLMTTLGWASTLLFGRVPQDRQIVLALITFGAVAWAALVVGVALPYVGAFLLAAVPAPGLISESWLRLGMVGGALVVPAIVGVASLFVVEPARRPVGAAMAVQVIRGYPLSAALAISLLILALVGVARFVHHLAQRWNNAHIAIVVRPKGYETVVADLERALDDAGLQVDRRRAPAILSAPGRILGAIAGEGIRALVPDELVHLRGPGLEVGLYPSDIAISGDKIRVARARAAIASRLTATAAWRTTSAEAQAIEARLERIAGGPASAAGASLKEIKAIDEELAVVALAGDEWEVLYRERLQVERDLLAGVTPGTGFPGDSAHESTTAPRSATASPTEPATPSLGAVIAAMSLLMVAADIALAVAERRRRR